MPVHERLDEIHTELEVLSDWLNTLTRSQHSMAWARTNATVLAVTSNSLRHVKLGVIGNSCGVYSISQPTF